MPIRASRGSAISIVPMPVPLVPLMAAALVMTAALVTSGCGGFVPAPRSGPGSAGPRSAGPGSESGASNTVSEPWLLPADATPTQRLFRVHYDGPQGRLSFKLSVYLEQPDRFRLQASDPLGRKLWALAVTGDDRALWLNHRDKNFCYTDADRGLVFIPLTELPLGAVPRLLLGRLPQAPFGTPLRDATDISYHDGLGREWTAALDAEGTPLRWRLLDGGESVAWWQRGESAKESIFSDRRGRQQVRWREIVRESFEGSMPETAVPNAYEEVRCQASTRRH